jgi:hypothetical protein
VAGFLLGEGGMYRLRAGGEWCMLGGSPITQKDNTGQGRSEESEKSIRFRQDIQMAP